MIELLLLVLFVLSFSSIGKIANGYIFGIREDTYPGRLLLDFGTGAGIFSLIIFVSGALSFINRYFFAAAVILPAIFSVKYIRRLKFNIKDLSAAEKIMLSAFILSAALNISRSYVPSIQSDALQYHLSIPARYIYEGRILDLSRVIRYSVFPQFMEMLFMAGMVVGNDTVARLIHTGFGIAAALALYDLGRRYFSRPAGYLGMLIFYLSPVVRSLSGTAMIDLGIAFYFFLAGYAALKWIEEKDNRWLLLYSAFCGFSFSIKYTGILSALWFPAAVFWKSRVNSDFRIGSIKAYAMPLLLFAALISPWLIKNYINTGNPVSPFMYSRLGGDNWNGYLEENWRSHLNGGEKSTAARNTGFAAKIFEHTPLAIAAFFILLIPRGSGHGAAWIFFLISAAYIAAGVSLMPHIYRFFLPALGLLSAVSAAVYLRAAGSKKSLVRVLSVLVLVLGLGNRMYETAYGAVKNRKVIIGSEKKEDFLARKLDCYGLADYINRNLSGGDMILSLNETRGYYFNAGFAVSHEVVAGSFVHTMDNVRDIISELEKRNIKYIMVNRSRYFSAHQRRTPLLENSNMERYFDLAAVSRDCSLYRIKEHAQR